MRNSTNIRKRNKAQVQMGETVAILLVFFFLMILGMVFYVNVIKAKSSTEKEDHDQLDAVTILKKALSLPELQCSSQNIIADSCIDLLKLTAAFQFLPQHQENYFDFFGFSVIRVQEIYPSHQNYLLYSFPLDKYSSNSSTNAPISLLNPVTGTNAFGIITIETYVR